MQQHQSDHNISHQLLRWAWALEITFVILGLLVALSFALSAYEGFITKGHLEIAEWNLIIIGSAVWVAVAFTELLKIPVTKGIIFTSSYLVKFISFLFLLFICLITFESIFTGLERSLTIRESLVNESRMKIFRIQNNIDLLDKEIQSIEVIDDFTIKKDSQETVKLQLTNLDDQIESLKIQIKELESPSESNKILALNNQIIFYEEDSERLNQSLVENKKLLNERLILVQEDERNELRNSFIWGRSDIREKYNAKRSLIEVQDNEVSKKINASIENNKEAIKNLNFEIQSLSSVGPENKLKINFYKSEIKNLIEKKSSILSDSNRRISQKISSSDLNSKKIDQINNEKFQLIQAIDNHRSDINKNGQDVIYSIAKRVFDVDEVADLSSEQVNFVALVIIVSLAGIVAFSGPLLTLIAMSNVPINKNYKKTLTFYRWLKLLIFELIKKIRKPKRIIKYVEKEVEVIKEVPVKKIVKEIIEIPKPVEITRYVGIPVPKKIDELPTLEEAIDTPKINNQEQLA